MLTDWNAYGYDSLERIVYIYMLPLLGMHYVQIFS